MSDTASDVRLFEPTPPAGDGSDVRAEQPPTASRAVLPAGDQPTIITGHTPIASPAMSDSTYRILEGRVMPGDRLGHFELVEFVGGGGMGRVFRALDTRLGRTVALKVLSPDQAGDADTLQRFQNEAQSSARLDHDNIARVHFVGEDRGLHFIAFEFVEGMNVRLLVERKGPLPLAEAVSYTLQVAEALAHADARSVVHRDIKPSNVLITPEGRAKLIDMGLARLRHPDPAVADLTASGVTLGTFDYISPEQARDPRNADIRSDIYSLGCTLYFMLAGQPPFPEGTVLQKLLQHQGDRPPEIQEIRPELPDEASRILRKMMAKDPGHRYAGPAELVADLLLFAEQIGLRPVSPTSRIWLTPQEPSVSFLQRNLPWIAPVAALVCIVLLLDLFSNFPGQPSPPTLPLFTGDEEAAPARSAAKSTKEKSPRQALIRATNDSAEDAVPAGKESSAKIPADAAKDAAPGQVPGRDTAAKSQATEIRDDRGRTSFVPPERAWLSFESSHGGLSAADEAYSVREAIAPGEVAPKSSTKEPSAAKAPGASSSPGQPLKQPGVLVVAETPKGEGQFATLSAACSAARSGDIIELRFNGPREDRPLRISNQRLTIRAGDGFEPILVFRPTGADPIKQPRSMIALIGGQMSLSNVAVELQVPRDVPSDHWSLFETWGGEMVRLDRCVLTVQNASEQQTPYHQDAAFFRAHAAVDSDSTVDGSPAASPLATIELVDSIARGEADFLRVDDLQPVHLTWDNGLLLSAGSLLTVAGSPATPKPDETLRIELWHVTAVLRGGLCRMIGEASTPRQLAAQFLSTNGVFVGTPGVPFVAQEGPADVESLRRQFVWSGDRNYYQNIDVFWTVRSLEPGATPEVMNFDAWKTYWGPSRENEPSIEPIPWKQSPEPNRPMHAQGLRDYSPEDPTFGNAARGAPGFQGNRLPTFPSEGATRRIHQSDAPRSANWPLYDSRG